MRVRGVTYDTGFVNAGVSTRERFDPEVVEREMHVIREGLHCTAVRVTGGDLDRLETASIHAAQAGLQVWFSPFTCDLTAEELLAALADGADRCERLRRSGADVFLTGSQLSLFTRGFLPGRTFADRIALLRTPEGARAALSGVPEAINAFLAAAVDVVAERFSGRISYASLPFEGVDWSRFDIVSTDAGYRSVEVATHFRDGVRALVRQGAALGKPVAITEFGCTTHRGAAGKEAGVI